jgi:hypothetical protein
MESIEGCGLKADGPLPDAGSAAREALDGSTAVDLQLHMEGGLGREMVEGEAAVAAAVEESAGDAAPAQAFPASTPATSGAGISKKTRLAVQETEHVVSIMEMVRESMIP